MNLKKKSDAIFTHSPQHFDRFFLKHRKQAIATVSDDSGDENLTSRLVGKCFLVGLTALIFVTLES